MPVVVLHENNKMVVLALLDSWGLGLLHATWMVYEPQSQVMNAVWVNPIPGTPAGRQRRPFPRHATVRAAADRAKGRPYWLLNDC